MSEDRSIGNIQGVSIKAGTTPGAAYVRKVTHPPSPMTNEYQGRPDCSQPNVVLLELKSEINVPPILVTPKDVLTTITSNPSSMLFLQPSGGVVSNYVFMWANNLPGAQSSGWIQPSNQNATATVKPLISQTAPSSANNSGYNFSNWGNDMAAHRVTYKSSTYYLNATNFNNQGTVTTAKFKPNIVYANDAATLLRHFGGCKKSELNMLAALRATYEHYGIKRDKSEEGYEIIDPSSPSAAYAYQILDFGRSSGQITTQGTLAPYMYCNTVMPKDASSVMTFSPKAATRPAKDGAFVVSQQVGPVLDWMSSTDTVASANVRPSGLLFSFYRVWYGGSWQVAPLINSFVDASIGNGTGEIQWGDLDWSYTLFEGLSVPTTTGTTLSSVPYVTVKSFTGLELQVQNASSLVSFQRTLPLPDPDAINMAVGIMHARPDSLPASANDLGSIASTVVKFLPTAVSWLKNLFGDDQQKSAALEKANQFVGKKNNSGRGGAANTNNNNNGNNNNNYRPQQKRGNSNNNQNRNQRKRGGKQRNYTPRGTQQRGGIKINQLLNQVTQLTKAVKINNSGGTTLPTYDNTPQ